MRTHFSVSIGIAKEILSPNTMKLIFLLEVIICLLQASNAEFEVALSKVICLMKRLVHTEIFIGTQSEIDQVTLSKRIFQECDFQIRVVSNFNTHGKTDLIAFAFQEKDKKVF